MTPERWGQVKELYYSVSDQTPDERGSILDAVRVRDPELCAEVESLLRESDDTWCPGRNPFENLELLERYAGSLIADRYRLVREIGRGGFGVVWLAHDLRLHEKPVVVKFLRGAGPHDDWIARKFGDEVRALAHIDHPGVVGILDTGRTSGGTPFLVMQYVEGVTLRSLIHPEGIPPVRVAHLVRQIGQALAAAHTCGVLHRDLKPENIMVQTTASGDFVRLIDFGIATIRQQGRSETTRVVGTIAYMAPEQLRGNSSSASDIFALGAIAREMLMESANGDALAVIRHAMSADPADRFQDAAEFGDALALALTGEFAPEPDFPVPVQQRALDVAAARRIPLRKPTEVVALIRRSESGGLSAILEIDRDFSVKPDEVRSKPFQLEFPLDARGHPGPLDVGLRIECPDFDPKSAFKMIRVPPDRDSDTCTFLIAPQYLGELRINVEVVHENVLVASRTLKTEAVTSDREADLAMAVVSIALPVTLPEREGSAPMVLSSCGQSAMEMRPLPDLSFDSYLAPPEALAPGAPMAPPLPSPPPRKTRRKLLAVALGVLAILLAGLLAWMAFRRGSQSGLEIQ